MFGRTGRWEIPGTLNNIHQFFLFISDGVVPPPFVFVRTFHSLESLDFFSFSENEKNEKGDSPIFGKPSSSCSYDNDELRIVYRDVMLG